MTKKISLLLYILLLSTLPAVSVDASPLSGVDDVVASDDLVLRGDLNGDGAITMSDVMYLVQKILNGKFPDEEDTNKSCFEGDNKVDVIGQEYHATILYQVLKNDDNTIDVIVPEYTLEATIMGDLTIGEYTVRNIPYDASKGSYYMEYADGTLSIHIKSAPASGTGLDGDYIFNNKTTTTSINVTTDGTDATIVNNYSIGNMPFPINTAFTGKQQ